MQYRVFARVTETWYIDVEADTPDKAMEIADCHDGSDFTACPDADFEITDAYELY